MRGPDTISETTSSKDLPQNGEFVSNTKLAQPRKRFHTTTSSLCTSARPEKPNET